MLAPSSYNYNCCANEGAGTLYCLVHDLIGVVPGERQHLSDSSWMGKPITRSSLTDDMKLVLMVAVVLTFLRIAVTKFFNFMATNRIIFRVEKSEKDKDVAETMEKFAESCWKILFYSASMLGSWGLCYKYGYHEDIQRFWPEILLWKHQDPPADIRYFYMFELGAYVSMLFSHVVLETVRKDFWVMGIHHLVTIFMVALSYECGGMAVGVAILAVHDVNDVLLELSKMLLYQGLHFLANPVFVIFVVAWVIFRLYIFPFHIVWSCFVDAGAVNGCFRFHLAVSFMLLVLIPMHVYWFYLILIVVVRVLQGKSSDPREDGDDDDDDGNNNNNNDNNKKKTQ